MVESRGSSLACAVGLFYALAVLTFGIRTWTRYRARLWTIDDYAYTAAFIFAIIHAVLVVKCIAHGYGRRTEDISEPDLEQIELAHYVGQFFYVLSFGGSRIACALFVSIAARALPLAWPARTIAALSGIWVIAAVLCLAFSGDVSKPWTGIVTQSLFFRWLGIESISILLEISLFILSTSLIWRLDMTTRRRIYITTGFGIRLSLIPIIAARLVYLKPSHNPTPTWSAITPALLTEAALALAITTHLVTALPSFLAALDPDETTGRLSKSTHRASSTGGDRYYRLDHLRSGSFTSRRCGHRSRQSSGACVTTPEIAWQPYQGFGQGDGTTAYPPRVHISSASTHDRARRRSENRWSSSMTAERQDGGGGAETKPKPMAIHRTTEVSIEYT